MRYLSVCSGIEAATVAWHPLGWTPVAFAEIDRFPSAVLAHRYPRVPNYGDFTTIRNSDVGSIDILVGGTPCQSFSIAGLRGGLADDRGNLALEFLKLAQRLCPKWLLWENVPGVLSNNKGRDFGSILRGMVECGYGVFYRVLDAQYFGLAQRRKRVFVVGYLGDWRPAAAVLLERESLSRNPAPRRQARKEAAPATGARAEGSGKGGGRLIAAFGGNNTAGSIDIATAVNTGPRMDFESETLITHALRGEGFDASEDGIGRGVPLVAVAIQERAVSENLAAGPQGKGWQEDCAYTLEARNKVQAVAFNGAKSSVRRLTPRECERLQGFPDDYTLIPYRGKPSADGPRYKALGNSMAVPVMARIGRGIEQMENMLNGGRSC